MSLVQEMDTDLGLEVRIDLANQGLRRRPATIMVSLIGLLYYLEKLTCQTGTRWRTNRRRQVSGIHR
jgi:hypothetical protein